MVQRHPSTPIQRAEGVAMLIAHAGEDGVVTHGTTPPWCSPLRHYPWRPPPDSLTAKHIGTMP